jgi:di/tripeptidase
MEIISVGADIADLHSPKERLGLDSFGRVFAIVCKMIEK